MQLLEVSGVPVLYIGRTVPKGNILTDVEAFTNKEISPHCGLPKFGVCSLFSNEHRAGNTIL